MKTLPFFTLDVFTTTLFTGNPLAVVLEADGLNPAQMQRIAAEFNLSETVFVCTPLASGAARLRIFTPARELPFAGHPTVGTACLLASLGLLPAAKRGEALRCVLEEGVGPVPVVVRFADGQPPFAELTAAATPEVRPADFDTGRLHAVLNLPAEAITQVQLASCGNPFAIVTLRQPESLAAILLDAAGLQRLMAQSWAHALYLVARGYEGEWRARMFAPDLGVGEDPATGSAAVAFAGALALADGRPDCEEAFVIHQGVEMGRPSLLHTRYSKVDGKVRAVCVAGHAVRVSEGRVRVA